MVWVLSLSPLDLSTQGLTPEKHVYSIRSSSELGCSKKHFGEYELFPSLISLSPLPSGHPEAFQRLSVRTSMTCYRHFILPKGRSQGFASTPTDYVALLRLAFASAPDHYAKGTPSHQSASTACRHTVSGSFSLPYSGFFSPFPHGTSSLSVSQEYLALPDGSGGFRQDFTCP
eukprot:gene36153-59203_t